MARAYDMTTLQRKQRVANLQQRKQIKEYEQQYQNYLLEQQKQQNLIKAQEQAKNDAGFFEKAFATIGDIGGNILSGALKAVEGIYDFGAGIVGGIGGIFDQDFQKQVQEHVAYDFVGTNITSNFNKWFDDSYLNDWGEVGSFVKNVASGVGQMLPAVAVTIATGGAGAGAFISPSMATLGISASGNATEQALQDEDTNYYRALLYGVASGTVEMATEKLFANSLTKNINSSGWLDNLTKNIGKKGIARIGKEMIEEGSEEALAELANPLLQNIYKDKGFFEDFLTKEHLKNIGESALVGGVTSLAYGGTLGNIGRNKISASENLSELSALRVKEQNLFDSGELFEGNNEAKIEKARNEIKTQLSENVMKMKQDARTKFIEENRLGSILNPDGSLIANMQNSQGINQQGQNEANSSLASLDKRYYSLDMRGQEQTIAENLQKQNVKVYSGEMTQEENTRYKDFKRAFSALSKKGLIRTNYVVAESSTKFDAYLDENTMVFGKDVFESDNWQKKLIHEVEHFTEGSKEWVDFAEFVFNETNLNNTNADILKKNYGITQNDIDSFLDNLHNNKLTEAQKLYLSEAMATQSEYLFGNEEMIARLTSEKRGIAQKILDKIKNFIKVLKAKTPGEKAFVKKLQKAQSLFEKALSKAGTGYIVDQASKSDGVDGNEKIQYNKKSYYNQYDTLVKQWAFASTTKNGDVRYLYNAQNNTWNKLVSDKSIEDMCYVEKSIKDTEQNQERIQRMFEEEYNENNRQERTTGESLDKSIEEYESISRGGNVHSNSIADQRTDGQIGGIHKKQQTSNRARDSRQGNGNKQQFSLKDSNGNNLSNEQLEFFKESKARDDDGNLQVVYHGTMNGEFTVFDASKSSMESDMGAGFYFSSSIDDVGMNYENGGQDLTNKIERLAERIESQEEIDYEEAKVKAESQLRKGSKLFEVYLDIKSPAYVGGNFDSPTYLMSEFNDNYNMEDFDSEEEYYEQIDQDAQEFVDSVIWHIDNEGIYDYNGLAEILYEAIQDGGITINALKEKLSGSIYAMNEDGDLATNEILRIIIEECGYDGIIDNSVVEKWGYNSGRNNYMEGLDEETRHYIVFKPEQIKLITNQKPTKNQDVRFSLKRDGRVDKRIANNTKFKVYSKSEAEQIINDIVANQLNFEDKFGVLRGKNRNEVVSQLFSALNTQDPGYRAGIASKIADFIIEKAIYEDMYEDGLHDEFLFQYDTLKEYRGKLDLDSLKGEIRYKFDDKANAIIMQWGKRTGERGLGVDSIAMELQERGIPIQSSVPSEQFFEIYDMYTKARNELKNGANKYKANYFDEAELKKTKNEIVKEILKSYDQYGKQSKLATIVKQYTDRINLLKETIKDLKVRNKAINNLFSSIDRVSGLEKYKSANIELNEVVLGLIKRLKKLKTYRGNLSKNVREIMRDYSEMYELIAEENGLDNPFADMVQEIAKKNGELTTTEIQNLDKILQNFIHNVRNYDKVFFEGRNQSDTELATQAVKETKEAVKVKDSGFWGALSKVNRWLSAPVWQFERLGSYRENAIMTKIFNELHEGNSKRARFEMNVAEYFAPFFEKNRKLVKTWNEQTFDIDGIKMSKGQMIDLYMLSLRTQAQGHLFSEGGIKGTIRLSDETLAKKGKVKDSINKGQDVEITQDTIKKIKEQFTDVDLEFIKMAQNFFNKMSKDAKVETDMALYGVSNVLEDNYIPIRVADDQIYKNLGDVRALNFKELFTVFNASFNKDTKPNSKNKIVVENIIDVINRHSKQIASYYGYAIPVKSFNRIFNKKLGDTTLRMEISKVNPHFEKYVENLLSDMQGNRLEKTGIDRTISQIRGWGAKAALGLNLKVLANQFVSLPASAAIGVKYGNIAKGFKLALAKKTDFEKLIQYSPMLYDRFRNGSNIDVGLLKDGQGIIGKMDVITDFTTAPIGAIDKFICGAVWNACLEQTKDSSKYKDYSDEHYKEAAKLTEKAVIKTQANYNALYRPAILREQNSFLQLSTMFMSEPLQQFSLLSSAIDKIRVAKIRMNSADANTRAEAERLYQKAKSEALHAVSAVVIDTILLTMIAQLFKWVKGKEDEDKVKGIVQDFADNYIGMFPFLKDIYSIFQGYDVTNMAYTGLTNTANAMLELYNIIDLLASGKQYNQAEINGKLRKIVLGLTQTFGVPLRNLETYMKGIIGKFSPSGVYQYDKFFYDASTSTYMKELNDAIEKGDDKLADVIIDTMLENEKLAVKDKKIRTEMKTLFEQGFDVFPKSVPSKVTHDGEVYELTNNQYKKFVTIYEKSNSKVSSLIESRMYSASDDEVKAKSIKFIYDYYYEVALKDLLGVDSDNKKYLFAQAIDIVKLAQIISYVSGLTSDTDKNGNTISGSKKAKITQYINSMDLTAVQKYMLMGYFGYKNANGENRVKSYIQSLNLTKTEKETLFGYCGY